MEGPSIVIAVEEFKKFVRRPISAIKTSLDLPTSEMKKSRLTGVRSWGKHLIMQFGILNLRVHFLMFGSYRINEPRENRIPKLELVFGKDHVYFYSCAIKPLDAKLRELYDWSTDLMSKAWDPNQAAATIAKKPERLLCDVLMDQDVFSGLGNIMKNEILFRQCLHPDQKVLSLSRKEILALVRESAKYAHQFYDWKKAGVLKRNWLIFRKKRCPICEKAVTKRPTGVGQRMSHFCLRCQPKRASVNARKST